MMRGIFGGIDRLFHAMNPKEKEPRFAEHGSGGSAILYRKKDEI